MSPKHLAFEKAELFVVLAKQIGFRDIHNLIMIFMHYYVSIDIGKYNFFNFIRSLFNTLIRNMINRVSREFRKFYDLG